MNQNNSRLLLIVGVNNFVPKEMDQDWGEQVILTLLLPTEYVEKA